MESLTSPTAAERDPFWAGTRACVFGGNGFLGRHLVAQLLSRGASVCSLSLPGPPVAAHPDLDARTGTLADPVAVRSAAEGARVAFLAAGPVGVGGRAARGMRTHPDALTGVLAALDPGTRLVLTSSVVAVGAGRGGEVLTEDSPFPNAGLRVGYVRAKRAAEELALAAGRERDVVVANPGYLFGPDDPGKSVMGRLCVRFWRGNLAFPPSGGINAVDVRDVAAGHLLAAERGAAGRRYILGGTNVKLAALCAALAKAAGARGIGPAFRPLPAAVLWPMAALMELTARVTGRPAEPSFELVRMFTRDWFASAARAEAELGYRARPLEVTLADAFAWHASRTRVTPRGLNRLWLRPVRV